MAMLLKDGVRILGIRPEMVIALLAAEGIYKSLGVDLVVTSVIDGKHMRGSEHYTGCAVDLRIYDLGDRKAIIAHERLSKALGDDFDVILEHNHIHVEFDPKRPY